MKLLDKAIDEVVKTNDQSDMYMMAFRIAKAFVLAFIQLSNSVVNYVEAYTASNTIMEYPKEDKLK